MILVVTAVDAERDAVLADLGAGAGAAVAVAGSPRYVLDLPAGQVEVAACGVGPATSAARTAALLAGGAYSLVVCAGIAGGFAGRARVGQVVLADRIVHADLGADSPDGFLSLEKLGFGRTSFALRPELVAVAASRTGAVVGPVLTVSTATGTDSRAAWFAARHAAVAEAMEGAGVYAAAGVAEVPMLEVRAVSNLVGRRDPGAWDIPGALTALGSGLAALFAGELPV
jgi:futalosine hydrolase